jgi:uncharacterized membrane protein (UPF0127 family)
MAASCQQPATTLADLALRDVTLPNGKLIKAEVAITTEDMERGMMFRTELADDRGMLFFHAETGKYPYWMFQCKIALDIIWMDQGKRIVEISANTPPCTGAANTCPTHGGHQPSKYVIELAAGNAARQQLKIGDQLRF